MAVAKESRFLNYVAVFSTCFSSKRFYDLKLSLLKLHQQPFILNRFLLVAKIRAGRELLMPLRGAQQKKHTHTLHVENDSGALDLHLSTLANDGGVAEQGLGAKTLRSSGLRLRRD